MTEDQDRKLGELYDFFMKPPVEGARTRAQEIEDAIHFFNAGRLAMRLTMWTAGAGAAIIAVINTFKTWISVSFHP